jgi:hypothetical protein
LSTVVPNNELSSSTASINDGVSSTTNEPSTGTIKGTSYSIAVTSDELSSTINTPISSSVVSITSSSGNLISKVYYSTSDKSSENETASIDKAVSATTTIIELIPTSMDQQLTIITLTGLITTPVVSSTESTNSANTVIISTSSGVLVILLVGIVILVVGSSLCLMRYRKKQLPLQEEVTTDTDILAQNNISYIPTGSQGINLEDNPSYSSTTAAADPNVDGVYIDINTSYNAIHHTNRNEDNNYI